MESVFSSEWRLLLVGVYALSMAALAGRKGGFAVRQAVSILKSYFLSFIPFLVLGFILWVASYR